MIDTALIALDNSGAEASGPLIDLAIRPEVYFRRPSLATTDEGLARLYVAVLDDALKSYCKSSRERSAEERAERREAGAWLFSDDRRWPFSFLNVCDALEIDPDAVRDRLQAWDAATPAARNTRAGKRWVRGGLHS